MPIDLQALYPRLIHLMLDTVFVVDRDNHIVFVSDACEALLGYKAKELIGTLITHYMHPEDLPATRISTFATATSARTAAWCTSFGRHSGPMKWVHASAWRATSPP